MSPGSPKRSMWASVPVVIVSEITRRMCHRREPMRWTARWSKAAEREKLGGFCWFLWHFWRWKLTFWYTNSSLFFFLSQKAPWFLCVNKIILSFSHLPERLKIVLHLNSIITPETRDMGGVSVQNAGCYSFKATAPRGLPMPKISSRGLDPGRSSSWEFLLRVFQESIPNHPGYNKHLARNLRWSPYSDSLSSFDFSGILHVNIRIFG